MPDYINKNVLLIGTGPMATAYAKVLKALNNELTVVGRSEKSAQVFEQETGIKPITGGINAYLETHTTTEKLYIIIAVGTEMLMPILLKFKDIKFKHILIEKPAAISIEELLANEGDLAKIKDRVFVAYNRRFYSSVLEAQKLIKEDGGLQSMQFEFTEWAHKIEPLQKAKGVKENWFFANSTHVVDLAFYLAGNPVDWHTYSKPGSLTWHTKTNFSGAGITDKGVVFAYLSNWESAGRWGIELLTRKRRIYLKPLEQVQIQQKGSIAVKNHTINDEFDIDFKPGLYRQLQSFFSDDIKWIVDLNEHIEKSKNIFYKILE